MDIYLVQHGLALSEEQDPPRPLSSQGRVMTEKMAGYLAARAASLIHPPISEVRHSGKLRAQQTADILAKALCPKVVIVVGRNMNPTDHPRPIYDELELSRKATGATMLAGHLPHLARLAGLLLAGDADIMPIKLVNSGVLKICPVESGWAVDWYLTPACVV